MSEETREKILAQARANREKHLAEGLYTEEEERRLQEMEFRLPGDDLPPLSRLEELQFKLSQSFDPSSTPTITSHRPMIGPLIVFSKKLLLKLMRPLLTVLFTHQTEFRRNLVDFTFEVLETNSRLEKRLDAVNQRVVRLVRRMESQAPQAAPDGASTPTGPMAEGLPDLEYLALEDIHRGTPEEIKARQEVYLEYFKPQAGPILDLGCGRGEFLELLAQAGIPARGIDLNREMAAESQAKGLEVERAEGLVYLRSIEPGSLGGVFMAQVIEHLELNRLSALLEAAYQALSPGGVIVAETINPQALITFASAFYLDPTHVKPIHPEAARFLLESTGFKEVSIRPLNPVPEELKLKPVGRRVSGAPEINQNLTRLNELIFGFQDYAVIGRR